jgi:Cd(II)/Pb(II)-responsive transcriptional regulator
MTMKIGGLAKVTGSLVENIRFYEREGLLPQAERTEGNYRIYGQDHAERLAFIRNCRNLDMTLNEIRALLRFKEAPTENCGEVNALLDEHIGHVADRIRELKALEKNLKTLRLQCQEANASKDCGILHGLSDPTESAARRSQRSLHVHGSH